MPRYSLILLLICSFFNPSVHAINAEDLLPPEQAFNLSAKALSAEQIELTWVIHKGYYLYRNKLAFESRTDSVKIGPADLPAGKTKHDDYFGDVVIYRDQLKIKLPVDVPPGLKRLKLLVKFQGCADIGVCYPPQKSLLEINLPEKTVPRSDPVGRLLKGLNTLKLNLFEDPLLPAEQAFRFFAEVKDPYTLHVNWVIADGYYLYRDKISFQLDNHPDIQLGDYAPPPGEAYHDEAFGQVEIYHQNLEFDIPLQRLNTLPQTIQLQAGFQGCADRGVCYPPMKQTVLLDIPEAKLITPVLPKNTQIPLSEQDRIVSSLHHDALWLTLLSFFAFGLLLAFTPCIFPMIPILSGIIVGQGNQITTRKAFLLSFSYVLASALTYTVFGILAALFGNNLQATFQEPWIIVLFSSIFILLSLSMFGFYNLELPKSLQSKLHNSSNKHRDGSYLGAAVMGALSSLIVGPCVAAPLAAALVYIGQTGDVILGGSSLFVLGFGMGVPLLLLGTSAGKILPKAGHWMNATKAVFGVIMLAVAVWMLDRILPAGVTMLLWALLLIIPSVYLKAIDPLPETASNWHRLWKGFGQIMLVYGILLLIGLSAGNSNPLQPLKGLSSGKQNTEEEGLIFQQIHTVDELDRHIKLASANRQWLMLDFYADWCISCKEMEAYTFSSPKIKQQLAQFVLIQADVTANNENDKALLKRFNLIGPPGIIFFSPDQQGPSRLRVIGYQDVETFFKTLQRL